VAITPPFDSVLIANRGEIAVRVARTCRLMGIRSIAVYSDADAGALHVRCCDDALAIGGTTARDSYLRGDLIIAAAKRSRAAAIHPGYGFLAENAEFAQACAAAGVTFIGPSPEAMRAVGDKIAAKKTAIAAGVAVLPGYLERDQARDVLEAQARAIGVPLLIKAAAGGGGRGMRLVEDLRELGPALDSARREAQAAFGDATVFLERYVKNPRHIEVQIMADQHGACLALGERECSIQRRYQKILEESPSTAVSPELRSGLEAAAISIARAVGYVNAGTIEFMLDEDGRFYFLEMNARLQVEHPVTEMIADVDLVRAQLVIASGGRLEIEKKPLRGHAIEVRIYAEDPVHDFLPATGRITTFEPPVMPGVRNDVAVEAGSEVTPAYDPMLAKLIVHDATRESAIERLDAALREYLIGGVATNIAFLQWLVEQPALRRGETTTSFLPQHFRTDILAQRNELERPWAALAAIGALAMLPARRDERSADPWLRLGGWRHATEPRTLRVDDEVAQATWRYADGGWLCQLGNRSALVTAGQHGTFVLRTDRRNTRFPAWRTRDGVAVSLGGAAFAFPLPRPPVDAAEAAQRHGGDAVAGSVNAPMSGTIVKVNVAPGETVKAFQVLVVMEAMKMEHAIVAPYPGSVTAISAKVGMSVIAGDVLAELAEA
jgi:3-methylcrotonyl-CoA carboxylase alpha subunit